MSAMGRKLSWQEWVESCHDAFDIANACSYSDSTMKHFLDADLLAVNAKRISMDTSIVAEFDNPGSFPSGRLISVVPSARMWKSDIVWYSADDEEAFAVFESAFRRLGIPDHAAPYLDLDREVRLFCGFLVVRSRCTGAYFHTDWRRLNNEAFTVMTPITANADNFGLLYKTVTGDVAEYAYRRGEAILFGDNFVHSTKPGRSDEPVLLLCFQFGTDRMKHWPSIAAQFNTQATLLRQPDGSFVRTNGKAARQIN